MAKLTKIPREELVVRCRRLIARNATLEAGVELLRHAISTGSEAKMAMAQEMTKELVPIESEEDQS